MLKLNFPRHTLILSEDRKAIVNLDMVQSIEVSSSAIYAKFPEHIVLLQEYRTEEEAKQGLLDLFKKLTKEAQCTD